MFFLVGNGNGDVCVVDYVVEIVVVVDIFGELWFEYCVYFFLRYKYEVFYLFKIFIDVNC